MFVASRLWGRKLIPSTNNQFYLYMLCASRAFQGNTQFVAIIRYLSNAIIIMKKFFLQFFIILSLFLHLSLAFQQNIITIKLNEKYYEITTTKTAIYLFLGWCLCYYFFTLYLYPSSSNGFNTLYYIFFYVFPCIFFFPITLALYFDFFIFYIILYFTLFFFHSLFDCYGDIVTWQMFFISFPI